MQVRLPLLIAFTAAAVFAAAPTAWSPEVSMRVHPVAGAVPSPDGKLIAYTQSRAVIETEKSEIDTQIFLAKTDGSSRIQLTRGEKSATAPSFSPDGHYLYFTSERSGKPNVWRIALDGGEAERLTDWKGEIGSFKVSPNGRWVAFAAVEPGDEEKKAKEKADFRIIDEHPKNHGLWVVPADPDSEGKRATKRLFESKDHVGKFDWSPDSRVIAFEHTPTPGANDWIKSDLSEVDVDSGKVTPLAVTGAAESSPFYSPDGKYLAFLRTTDPPRWPGIVRIVVMTRKGGEARELPPTYDERPALLGWSGNSEHLIFSEARGTTTAIYQVPLDGSPQIAYEPSDGTLTAGELNWTGTALGLERQHSNQPPEAYFLQLGGDKPVRVSAANLDLPNLPIGKTERISWKGPDGIQIEGLLTYPVNYAAGTKVPLVLVIHGGPTGVFQETFLGNYGLYPYATFSARGYAVLRANPRGSGGYGRIFRFANINDWGGKDYEDLMAGVDRVVDMGVADPDRLAVMGWSYGGFMTSWVITHTHRFKAACVGAGVTDLLSFTGTSDIPGFLPDYFSGEPWENLDAYYKHSPMAFVKGVTTPTLILHGEADVRVPTSQGYELYSALKRQEVPAQMVVYPRTPHGPREPKFLLDIMQRHLGWLERYLR